MNGVERPDGFGGERATGSNEHLVRDRDQLAAAGKSLQPSDNGSLLFGAQAAGHPRAPDRAMGFGERERRGDAPCPCPDRRLRRRRGAAA
jgi:hypothetical protein